MRVPLEELVEFMRSHASGVGQPLERRSDESVLGEPPDVLYVLDATAATNGYFSDEEKAAIESKLGATLEGYVSVHFTSTHSAFTLADALAHEIGRMWHGILDYSGTGGWLGIPPPTRSAAQSRPRIDEASRISGSDLSPGRRAFVRDAHNA